MDLPSEESSELTELTLNPEITKTLPPDALIDEEAGLGFLQEINTQAPADLACDTYNMPLMSTSMLADLPLAEIDFDLSNQNVGFEFDWPQSNTMDNISQLDLNIQQEETNVTGTWPLEASDPNHELSLQPFTTMPQSESTETFNIDTFLSDMWPIEGPIGDQALGDCIEMGASSSAETGHFEWLNTSLNDVWSPSLDWSTELNNLDRNVTIGEITADSTHLSNDAVWSSDLLNLFDTSSHASTNLGAQISHDTLSHQNVPTLDGNSAQPVLSVTSGAPTQELHPHSEPLLATPRAETHLPIATAALPMGTLGPVRPVTLPPLRRGGTKGPLSAEERQARKQMRRRGVCIRCRRLKKKCNGGLPCESCLHLSKATLYISPCAMANFFDIVKLQPYFLGSAAQQKALEGLDKATVVKAGLLVCDLGQSGANGKIQSQTLNLPYKTYALVNWIAAANVLKSMLEKAADNDAPMSDHLSQIADVQLEPSSWHQHPILIHNPPRYREKGEDLLYLLFCAFPDFEFKSWKNPMSDVSDEEATDVGYKTLHILIWITKRRLEQKLFQRLQGYVNKLNTLSSSQLKYTAALILRVILFGKELADSNFADVEIEQTLSVELSQRHPILQSLICYLKIVTNKIPAWSGFWKHHRELIMSSTPKVLVLSLYDSEIYDKRSLRMENSLKHNLNWYEDFGNMLKTAENTSETHDMHLAHFFGSIIHESYVDGTTKAVISRMDQFCQTKIREPPETTENAGGKVISLYYLPVIRTIRELFAQAEEEKEVFRKSLKEVKQRMFSRADADPVGKFDLIGAIEVPLMSSEVSDLCVKIFRQITDSAGDGTH